MKMNERVAHLEATVCQLVDNIHELDIRIARKEEVIVPVNCDNPACWCKSGGVNYIDNSCDATLWGRMCGLWMNHEGAHRMVWNNNVRITWEVTQS